MCVFLSVGLCLILFGPWKVWADDVPLAGTFRFCNGPEFPGATGAIHVAQDGGVALRYDFSGGGNYVAAYCDLDQPQHLKTVRFRLEKPREATITVRVFDAAGQCFQKSLHYDGVGPRDIAANMSGWEAFWGGPSDGVLRMPINCFGVLVESRGLDSAQGVIVISAPRFERAEADEPTEYTAAPKETLLSYRVTDFGADCVLARSAGASLRNRKWQIDFTHADTVSMSGSLSLFHRPTTLTFRAKASAPGAALVVHIGAHFQNFKRTVGVFDGTAQQFTFTLPPDGWAASGAAHETLHYPLRISAISVERHDCAVERLEIVLDDLSCETMIEPAAAVVLTSSLDALPPSRGYRELSISCKAWNLLEAPLSGYIQVRVENWDGAALHSTEIPVTLKGGGDHATVKYQFSVPAIWRYVDVRCRFEGDGQRPAETLATFTADLDEAAGDESLPVPDRDLRPESPWGMGVYLYRYPHTEAGLARMDRAAALAAEAGVKWTREEFNYGMIEKAPGVYDFSFFDALVSTAYRHGISVYALLSYWSPFIENPYTDAGIEAYCDYARATVRRYKDYIKHWEIYNEPNIFFWEGPKELYPVLLERAYGVIKEEDPDAEVLGISTAGIDRGFIRMVLREEAPFDALTIHPYRSQFIERNFIRELEHAAVLVGNRPVWITEMGWSTQVGTGGKTEREQAQLLARAYLSAVGAGVRNMGWYNFRNDGDDPFYNEVNFGVLRSDLTPKAAYRALAVVCRSLPVAGDTPVGWRDGGDGAQGLYALGVGQNTAFWAPRQDMTLVVETPSDQILTWLNLMGEPIHVAPVPVSAVSPRPPRGCRSTADMGQTEALRLRHTLQLQQGNPVFALGGDCRIMEVIPHTVDEAAMAEVLF